MFYSEFGILIEKKVFNLSSVRHFSTFCDFVCYPYNMVTGSVVMQRMACYSTMVPVSRRMIRTMMTSRETVPRGECCPLQNKKA